jgi:hypothetical protein
MTEPVHDPWPFAGDADHNDPLTTLRIAATGPHPAEPYLVAFDRTSPTRPTDAEARALACYLDYYKLILYRGDSRILTRLQQLPLDVDHCTNPLIFHRFGDDDWGFRRHRRHRYFKSRIRREGTAFFTERWPAATPGQLRRFPLAALLDDIEEPLRGTPNPTWQHWKNDHPEVFPVGAAAPAIAVR